MSKTITQPIIDIQGEADFAERVLKESHERPVIVDFWAPWCGPCKMLGPILEQLAKESQGRWLLAKVNTDEHPTLARQYQIQGIPAVKAFFKGKLHDEFVGALPRAQIEQWLAQFLPGPEVEYLATGQQLEASGQYSEARAAYEQALEAKPMYAEALVGLARIALAEDDKEQAKRYLNQLTYVEDEALSQEIAQLKLKLQAGDVAALESLRAQLEEHPEDLSLRLQFAHACAAQRRDEEAMEAYLKIIEETRSGPGEEAREALLQLFEVVGMHAELTKTYRAKLAQLLFS